MSEQLLHVYSCTRCPFWLTERWAFCALCGGRMVEQTVQTDTPGFSLTEGVAAPTSPPGGDTTGSEET